MQNLVDQDLWGHLAFGRDMCTAMQVPRQDVYAWVPTHAWFDHEWLCEVIYYVLLVGFGSTGLLVFKGVAGAVSALSLGGAAFSRAPRQATAVLVLSGFAMYGIRNDLYTRPYIFTYMFFAVTLFLLESGRIWLLPLLIAVWANCHGAFVVGLGTTAIYLGDASLRADRKGALGLAAVLATSVLATLLNPYGASYWPFVLRAVTMQRPYITEWRPVPWAPPAVFEFWQFKVLVLVALMAVAVSVWRGPRRWPAYAVLAVTAWMALSHYRHVPFFMMACVAYLPAMIARDDSEEPGQWLPLLLSAIVLIQLVMRPTWSIEIPIAYKRSPYVFPLRAAEFMTENRLRGNVLCWFDWGEFLIWQFSPQVKVSFDGRLETVYSDDVIRQNIRFSSGQPGGEELLRGADLVLARQATKAVDAMRAQGGWRLIYEDSVGALFAKTDRSRFVQPPPCEATDMSLDQWLERPRCP